MKVSTAARDVQQSFKVYTKKEVVSCKYHQKGFQQKWVIETVFCITSEAGTKTNEMTAMRTRYLYNLKIIVICCAQTSNTFFISSGSVRIWFRNGFQGNLTFCTNGTSYEAGQTSQSGVD